MKKRTLLHVVPSGGGIAEYSEAIDQVYALIPQLHLETVKVYSGDTSKSLQAKIAGRAPDFVHFEIGANDAIAYCASRLLLRSNPGIRQLVTIHDTGIIVAHPSGQNLPSGKTLKLAIRKVFRLALEQTVSRYALNNWMQNQNITFITLRKDALSGAHHLPMPVYTRRRKEFVAHKNQRWRIGFAGYWDRLKGIGTLLDAFLGSELENSADLILYGGSFEGTNLYVDAIREKARHHSNVIISGSIKDGAMHATLRTLDVLVLPYSLKNPAGVSAMAMHAAEIGLPVVASRAPQIVSILRDYCTYYQPDNDADALRQAIIGLKADYEEMVARSRKLQEVIFRDHSHLKISTEIIKLLDI